MLPAAYFTRRKIKTDKHLLRPHLPERLNTSYYVTGHVTHWHAAAITHPARMWRNLLFFLVGVPAAQQNALREWA